jgi:DNA (cytosine-5)-methyltransferase 1
MVQFNTTVRIAGPSLIVIDFFCGGGGTSKGFEESLRAWVVACINHDELALKSHALNHPFSVHFNEDISKMYGFVYHGVLFRTPELLRLIRLVDLYRAFYPEAKIVVWASLECTEFSNAKGGLPKNADSRTLPKHMEVYIDALQPDIVQIENVREFKKWGPLDEKRRPIKEREGEEFDAWRQRINSMGYRDEWKMLNSANLGSHQKRDRLFGVFAKDDIPIAWPKSTHAKQATKDLFESMEKWKPVSEVLDLGDIGNSIIWGKKKRSTKTYERVLKGCQKHLRSFDGDMSFLSYYYGNSYTSLLDSPSGTTTTKDRMAMVTVKKHCKFIYREYGTATNTSLNDPIGALPTNPKANIVTGIPLMYNPSWGGHFTSTDDSSVVIVARQDKAPLMLLTALKGDFKIPVYEDDCENLKLLKQFMADNGFVDICMRCLNVKELLKIQGFPEDYHLVGNQSQQKKFIGNAVVPIVVKHWTIAMAEALKST